MDKTSFSVIVVCLNPGEALKPTVDSILGQDYDNFEVIIKDGGSTDGSVDDYRAGADPRVKFVFTKDTGIYDAMNQAVGFATGDYVLFLNAGDRFFDGQVLSRTASADLGADRTIAYGDTFFEKNGSLAKAAPRLTASGIYRNYPCHQSIFYSRDVLLNRRFQTGFKIRADYEHLLYNFFKADTAFKYLGFTVASYEGGGVSEKPENVKRDRAERRKIVDKYYSKGRQIANDAFLVLSGQRIRKALNENPKTSKLYQSIRNCLLR